MISNTLTALSGARIFSHYAASSSALVSGAPLEANIIHILAKSTRAPWRSLGHTAGPPSEANTADQSGSTQSLARPPFETPQGQSLSSAATWNAQGGVSASATPATPPAPAPRLKQLHLPSSVLADLRPPVQPYQLLPVLSQRPTGAPAQYTPWSPTRALQRRKHVAKRMGFLMQILECEQMERVRRVRPVPDFRAGDILELRMMLPEAERKVAIYRGVCIARYKKSIRSSFKIYNVYPECGGVVQHIPLYMPDLLGIKVVGRIHSTQERLFYLLDRESSDYTFQQGVTPAN